MSRWRACSTHTPSLRPRASRSGGSLRSARVLGDPRLGMAGAFLSLRRVIPNDYPLDRDVEWYIADEQRLGRLLDYAVIAPRLQRLYEWSAEELGEPRLLELVRDGSPIYAWPYEQRHVWRAQRHALPGPGYSNASRGSADAAAAPEAGQLLARARESPASLRAGSTRAPAATGVRAVSRPPLVSTTSGGPNDEGAPSTDHVPAPGPQIAKPIRLLAIEQRDDESPAAPERKERRSVLAARASTAVEDDRPRWHEPGIQALDAVGDPLVEARDSSESFIAFSRGLAAECLRRARDGQSRRKSSA